MKRKPKNRVKYFVSGEIFAAFVSSGISSSFIKLLLLYSADDYQSFSWRCPPPWPPRTWEKRMKRKHNIQMPFYTFTIIHISHFEGTWNTNLTLTAGMYFGDASLLPIAFYEANEALFCKSPILKLVSAEVFSFQLNMVLLKVIFIIHVLMDTLIYSMKFLNLFDLVKYINIFINATKPKKYIGIKSSVTK